MLSEAAEKRRIVELEYLKEGEESPSLRRVEPYTIERELPGLARAHLGSDASTARGRSGSTGCARRGSPTSGSSRARGSIRRICANPRVARLLHSPAIARWKLERGARPLTDGSAVADVPVQDRGVAPLRGPRRPWRDRRPRAAAAAGRRCETRSPPSARDRARAHGRLTPDSHKSAPRACRAPHAAHPCAVPTRYCCRHTTTRRPNGRRHESSQQACRSSPESSRVRSPGWRRFSSRARPSHIGLPSRTRRRPRGDPSASTAHGSRVSRSSCATTSTASTTPRTSGDAPCAAAARVFVRRGRRRVSRARAGGGSLRGGTHARGRRPGGDRAVDERLLVLRAFRATPRPGDSVTLPAGGADAPQRSLPLDRPADVALGAHAFGQQRSRTPASRRQPGAPGVARSGSNRAGISTPIGGSSFDVDAQRGRASCSTRPTGASCAGRRAVAGGPLRFHSRSTGRLRTCRSRATARSTCSRRPSGARTSQLLRSFDSERPQREGGDAGRDAHAQVRLGPRDTRRSPAPVGPMDAGGSQAVSTRAGLRQSRRPGRLLPGGREVVVLRTRQRDPRGRDRIAAVPAQLADHERDAARRGPARGAAREPVDPRRPRVSQTRTTSSSCSMLNASGLEQALRARLGRLGRDGAALALPARGIVALPARLDARGRLRRPLRPGGEVMSAPVRLVVAVRGRVRTHGRRDRGRVPHAFRRQQLQLCRPSPTSYITRDGSVDTSPFALVTRDTSGAAAAGTTTTGTTLPAIHPGTGRRVAKARIARASRSRSGASQIRPRNDGYLPVGGMLRNVHGPYTRRRLQGRRWCAQRHRLEVGRRSEWTRSRARTTSA